MNLKKKPRNIYNREAYCYDLPPSLIAQEPLQERDQARLMIIDRQGRSIQHDTFAHINKYVPPSSHFVLNNTRVIPARMMGHKTTGGAIEVFLLKALSDGYSFEALLRPLKKIKEGEQINFTPNIHAVLVDKEKRIVRFNKKNIIHYLQEIGHIPLPPYIKRQDTVADRQDYQTVYAKKSGSVASPTAGLHFTKPLLNQLKAEGHRFSELTLHINYGTFKPVACEDIREHVMHKEYYAMTGGAFKSIFEGRENTALKNTFKGSSRPIIAVGTTSCRTLETVAQNGILEGESDLFIYLGYRFCAVDHLITNFHLPYSSLLMLVSAFGGYDLIMRAYKEAIVQRYRFYSYGDAMLII